MPDYDAGYKAGFHGAAEDRPDNPLYHLGFTEGQQDRAFMGDDAAVFLSAE